MENETYLISNTTTYLTVGDFDSSENDHLLTKKHKIHTHEQNTCYSGSKFEGVVSQHDGHFSKENAEHAYNPIFKKELTQSDISICLVIPKKYATKYLPQTKDEEMTLYDRSKNLWKFRYYYYKKGRKFVFTKGWRKFVKDKCLKAKDTIIFNLCESKNGTKENCITYLIDVVKNSEILPMDLALNHHQQKEAIDDHEVETKEFMREQQCNHDVPAVVALVPVMLFGKQIGLTKTNGV